MHGSDSVESAQKEIALWFKEEELVSWEPAAKSWVYEDWIWVGATEVNDWLSLLNLVIALQVMHNKILNINELSWSCEWRMLTRSSHLVECIYT